MNPNAVAAEYNIADRINRIEEFQIPEKFAALLARVETVVSNLENEKSRLNDLELKLIKDQQLLASMQNLKATIDELKYAEKFRAEKDDVVKRMTVIPIPICAAILGRTEDEIYRFRNRVKASFGSTYCGAWCYSFNELVIFAEHPRWFSRDTLVKPTRPEMLNFMASYCVLVDAELAAAYLNVAPSELPTLVPVNGHSKRPYRLQDIQFAVCDMPRSSPGMKH